MRDPTPSFPAKVGGTGYDGREPPNGTSYSGALPEIHGEPGPPPEPERRSTWQLPLLLFVLTCVTTLQVGGPAFAVSLMIILLCHEFGHYLQARRYGVPASLPYFIPLPPQISLIGTMGAVIAMRPNSAKTRALFDLAITGPIAGLVPALAFSAIGLRLSTVSAASEKSAQMVRLGEPLIFKFLSFLVLGDVAEGNVISLHPIAYAGWVGILITALNLLPIGQLDGGHILYTLIPRKAHLVSFAFLASAALAIVLGTVLAGRYWWWSIFLALLLLLGARHPPTTDNRPLDRKRAILGVVTLLFFPLGITPSPFMF